MVWALPVTMLRPYKQFEDHLNTICIPGVLETPKTIEITFSAYGDRAFIQVGCSYLFGDRCGGRQIGFWGDPWEWNDIGGPGYLGNLLDAVETYWMPRIP